MDAKPVGLNNDFPLASIQRAENSNLTDLLGGQPRRPWVNLAVGVFECLMPLPSVHAPLSPVLITDMLQVAAMDTLDIFQGITTDFGFSSFSKTFLGGSQLFSKYKWDLMSAAVSTPVSN